MVTYVVFRGLVEELEALEVLLHRLVVEPALEPALVWTQLVLVLLLRGAVAQSRVQGAHRADEGRHLPSWDFHLLRR